jgi:glycolate oxidase
VNQADPLVERLGERVGANAVLVDPDILRSHDRDQATFCPAGTPRVLVRPTTVGEVREVIRTARDFNVPVVPQGARTGLSGGANAVNGCILLSTQRMDRIVEIDAADQVAVVQPGVLNAQLSRAVADVGLFYPPDPSSWEQSTIGGNVATNAGGLCCVKYGVTADFVRGLEVVLGTGEVLRTGRRTTKGVAGYDLTHLLVGSEGTLGVITEITLALRPASETALTVAATFRSGTDALAAAAAVMAAGLRPSMLEFIDQTTARAIQHYRDMGLPEDVGGLLLAQSDRAGDAAKDIGSMAAIFTSRGALEVAEATDAEEANMLMEARRLVNAGLDMLGPKLVDDVAVPLSRLPQLLRGIEEIGRDLSVTIACPGHVGDGNMHPTVIVDPASDDGEERALRAFDAVMELGLRLGGTITGEHGVGLLKRNWLEKELGSTSASIHRQIRTIFDPLGLLNPGKVLDAAAPGSGPVTSGPSDSWRAS